MTICCQEPADAWMVRQMQVEAGLEDTEIFLALIKLLLILT